MNRALLLLDTPAARSLAKKLCTRAKPNAIILLTEEEMSVYRHGMFLELTPKEELYFDNNLLETGE